MRRRRNVQKLGREDNHTNSEKRWPSSICKLQGHNIVKCSIQNINDSDKQEIERSFGNMYRRVPVWVQETKIHGRCHPHDIPVSWEVLQTGKCTTYFYIDFRKAFDSLRRKGLLEDMKAMEIQRKLRSLIEMTIKRFKVTILTEEGETEKFEFNTGVRQGDGLSTTLLFSIYPWVR